jgi:DNA-binding protein HU-beta
MTNGRWEAGVDQSKIVEQVAVATGLDLSDAEAAVQALFDGLVEALAAGESVELGDFGTFEVDKTAARQGRKPSAGERNRLPATKVVRFRPGKSLNKGL